MKTEKGNESMNIILKDRDHKILRLCYEQQFILTEHAEDFFEGSTSYRSACYRLQQLRENGFLEQDDGVGVGKKPVFRVTKLGAEIISQSGGIVSQVRTVNPATLIHDALVTSVRQRLEKFWGAKFIPEGSLKQQDFKQVPDGVFQFKSGQAIAIEIENSDKGRTRFTKLLNRWSQIPDISFVLYIASSDSLFASIEKWLAKGPTDQPMGVVRWNDLKSGTPVVSTLHGPVRLFDKREF